MEGCADLLAANEWIPEVDDIGTVVIVAVGAKIWSPV